MKVVILTTSYPRHEGDVAGLFVRDAVEDLRAVGVEIEVVSPASFRHHGIAVRDGITGTLVAAASPQAVRKAVERLLADDELRSTLGREARSRTQTLLTHEAAASALTAEYQAAAEHTV